MRKLWVGLAAAATLGLLMALTAFAGQLSGTWTGQVGQEFWSIQFNADGTFTRQVKTGGLVHNESGRFQVQGNNLQVKVDGQAEGYTLQFRLATADVLDLYEDGKHLARLTRGSGVQSHDPRMQPVALSPLQPKQAYQNSGGGSIVFTRYEPLSVTIYGRSTPVPTPKLYIMNSDGSGQRPFIYPPAFDRAESPNWSPGYRYLLFSCNYQATKSALYQDIFALDRAKGTIRRLTGNEWSAGPVKGYGMIAGTVHDDTTHVRDQMRGEASALISPRSQIMITAQGIGGRVVYAKKTVRELKQDNPDWDPEMDLPIDPYKWMFVITNVPAGKVWVKAWKSKYMGHMMVVDVLPGQVTKVDLTLSKGNYLVSHPSITPDGRYLVAMSHHCYFYGAMPSKGQYSPKYETNNAVVVADLSRPDALPMIWNRMNAVGVMSNGKTSRGWMAKSPRLSPDGSTLAISSGVLETLENLAVCSLLSVLQGRPRPKIVVPNRRVLASHQEANDWPAWSPDGRRIAFVRSIMAAGGNMTGNLFVVNVDGSGLRQVTQVARNQAAAYPSWSPDGRHIAFQVVTSKRSALNITDLATTNFTIDIWKVGADGSGLQRLTTDGRSGEPAWGP